jgi:hypothetical protein
MLDWRSLCDLAIFLAVPDGLRTGLGACIARGSAQQKEIEMRTHVERPVRMWIAGISICLLAASGTVAIVRSIPASYANIPDKGALPRQGAAPRVAGETLAKDLQAQLAGTINPRSRARCPECGVVESMRQIKRSGDVGRQDVAYVKVARGASGGAPVSAIAANAITANGYEMTVRFRDGSTTVFNEANPRTWRLGTRVMVIGRSVASND